MTRQLNLRSWLLLRFLIFAQLLAFAGAAFATAPPMDPGISDGVIDRVASKLMEVKNPTTVLLFDHRKGTWHGCRWSSPKPGTAMALFCSPSYRKIDENNKIEVEFEKGERPRIFVIDTNPLLYNINAEATTVIPNPDEEDLGKFLALLASTATAAVQASAPQFAGSSAVSANESMENLQFSIRTESLIESPSRAQRDKLSRMEAELELMQAKLDFLNSLRQSSNNLAAALKPPAAKLASASNQLNGSLSLFAGKVSQINEDSREIIRQLRRIESGANDATLLNPTVQNWSAWDQAVANLQDSARAAASATIDCAPVLSSLADLIGLSLAPLPGPGEPARFEVENSFTEIASGLNTTRVDSACGGFAPEIKKISRLLSGAEFPPFNARPVEAGRYGSDRVGTILQPLHSYLGQLAGLVATHTSRLGAAKTALAGRAAAEEALVANLGLFQRQSALKDPSVADLTQGIVERPLPNTDPIDIDWGEAIDSAVKITALPIVQASKILSKRPAEVTAAYRLSRSSFRLRLEYDFSLVHTDVASPVYTAVSVPDPEATTEPKTISVIRQTDEESRSGHAALFLTLTSKKPKGFLSWGGQLGFSLETEKPAAFAGLSLRFGKYFALSGGWSYYQVKELKDQVLEQKVADTAAIQTRNTFADGTYVAISITINDLSVFKPKE